MRIRHLIQTGPNILLMEEILASYRHLIQTEPNILLKVEIFLYKLGQRHVDYLPKDMKPEYFDVLRVRNSASIQRMKNSTKEINIEEAVHDGFNDRMQSLTRRGELTTDECSRAIQVYLI